MILQAPKEGAREDGLNPPNKRNRQGVASALGTMAVYVANPKVRGVTCGPETKAA